MRAVPAMWLLLASACSLLHFDTTEALSIKHNLGIYGGKPANITEVPFMVNTDYCGASIIHEQFLVSAAHCGEVDSVWVGSDIDKQGDRYEVDEVFLHPNFSIFTHDYDLSVIKLKEKLIFNDRVKLIELADFNEMPSPGDDMKTLGWGYTEHHKTSHQLLEVNVPYVENEKCRKVPHLPFKVTERMICAGGEEDKDSCQGDSGGPLIYKNRLIGVVSWGIKCGLKGYPGVYAYLPSMRDFIEKVIKINT